MYPPAHPCGDPRHGPTYIVKLDLSDGFYRVRPRAEDIPKLGLAFPAGPGEEPLVALPLTLPKGWTESPPYFCSATKTLVDLINLHASPSRDPPRHPLEPATGTQPPLDGCPWGGRRTHPTSPAPLKPWWTSSIYMPPHPGTHHGILWSLPQAHSPHWMVGTASLLPHPLTRHHLDSRFCHISPCPSNAIAADHWPIAMSSSMTKFCWLRAHQIYSNGSSARRSTSMTGSSGPTITMTIQKSTKSPSLKANFLRVMPVCPPPK